MAYSSLHPQAPAATTAANGDYGEADAKTSRLVAAEGSISACEGDAWGVESSDCLRAIVKASGHKMDRNIRVIASARINHTRPNYF